MHESRVEIERGTHAERIYDRLRARIRPAVPGASSDLRDLLLAFPDLFMLLTRLLRDDRVKPGDKALALLGVAYVISPIDLMPAWLFGPFGVLDDVLVVVGGIIPDDDAEKLRQAGVRRIYTPKDYDLTRIVSEIVDTVAESHAEN